jgi:hypothetical protein
MILGEGRCFVLHLRDLHCFMQVYESRSFSRAADSLDTVQSLISTRIQRLEEFIGAPLFVRLHRGVVSTDKGELLYKHAKRVLRDVAELESAVRRRAMLRRLLVAAVLAGGAGCAAAAGEAGADGTRLGAWPQRAPMDAPRGDPFALPERPRAPRTAPAAAQTPAPATPVPAAAPPMPYRVAGSIVADGVRQVLLAKGDAVFPIRPGDMLEGDYRVNSIGDDEVTLVYLPLGVRESLPLLAAAHASRTARMRWDGPERVQAGQRFTVILRVTSDGPLRAAALEFDLELSFDAAVLEPVSVQPGKAFDAGGFAHRVVPGGSILVGASGRSAGPVTAPPDAELLVLVFKAIRPAETTELNLASFTLQGAVGKPLAVEPPGAFRAAIAP